MTGNELVSLYEFSYGALNRNLEGVTNEDSLFIPQPAGNCINWVLGHVVSARNLVLTLAGGVPVDRGDDVRHYQRGSGGISARRQCP